MLPNKNTITAVILMLALAGPVPADEVITVASDSTPAGNAGSFSRFRVDIELASDPSVVRETMWFARGEGFVRNQGYRNTFVEWRDELQDNTIVGGTGYMPAAGGNTWSYSEISVNADNLSWSALKLLYQ